MRKEGGGEGEGDGGWIGAGAAGGTGAVAKDEVADGTGARPEGGASDGTGVGAGVEVGTWQEVWQKGGLKVRVPLTSLGRGCAEPARGTLKPF